MRKHIWENLFALCTPLPKAKKMRAHPIMTNRGINMNFENIKRIVLASNSPRRKEILEMMGFSLVVCPSSCDENIDVNDPIEYAMTLSKLKSESVATDYPDDYVIGADTIVVLGDTILGKPTDKEDALSMLRNLSGKTHRVITGVSICRKGSTTTFYDETLVTMYDNPDDMLTNYINTGEPMDKAGAYGIQGIGAMLVKEIKGDFYNVMGLPIGKLVRYLKKCG